MKKLTLLILMAIIFGGISLARENYIHLKINNMKKNNFNFKQHVIIVILMIITLTGKSQFMSSLFDTDPNESIEIPCNTVETSRSEIYLSRQWQMIDLGNSIGGIGMYCLDINNDSIDEIIINGGGGHLHIMKYDGERYADTWCRKIGNGISHFIIEDLDHDFIHEIYIMTGESELICYKADSMNILYTHAFNFTSVNHFHIADVDNDSIYEIIISNSNYSGNGKIAVYNLETFEEEWQTTDFGSYNFEISDVDNDSINEIVLSEGVIFDGQTHEIDWQYNDDFGIDICLSDVDNDGTDEIIGLDYSSITAFDGINNTPIWQFSTVDANDCFIVTDLENDGIEEILTGGDQWGDISCYSSETQQLMWSINNPDHGVTNLACGDPDFDGIKEVMWGAGASSSGADIFYIASTEYYQIEWNSMDMDGPFFVNTNDLQSDEITEILITSNESNSGYDGGNLLIFNGLDHKLTEALENLSGWGEINLVKAININNTPQSEIVIGMTDGITILDGSSFQQLFSSNSFGSITTIEIMDIDNDNEIEIILGNSNGKVYIINGEDYSIEWQSIDTGTSIGLIRIDDCDNDGELEIVFNGQNDILQVYGATTHFLEWQSIGISEITSFDISDLDRNGIKEFVIAHDEGEIILVNCETHNIILQEEVTDEKISFLETALLDSSAFERILIIDTHLKVLNGDDMSLIWESELIGNDEGYGSPRRNIRVCDIDFNQKKDIFVGNEYGVIQYECNIPYPDITPPHIITFNPESGFSNASIDIQMQVLFSEEMNLETLTSDNISLLNSNNDELDFEIQYNYNEDISELFIIPTELLDTEDEITVLLSGNLTDTSLNGLDGNGNGIPEGSPEDDFYWSFYTGSGIDTIPPTHILIQIEPDTIWKGVATTLDAIFTDSSQFAMSPIVNAEYFIDVAGNYGEGIPLSPVDGNLNSVYEECQTIINTDNFTNGNHSFFVHARDLSGNWSDFDTVNLYILTEMESNWNMYAQNAQHTSFNPNDTIQYPVQLKWEKGLCDATLNEPIIINNMVYTTSGGWYSPGTAYCINLSDGEIIWEKIFGNVNTITGPSFGYGKVYLQAGIDDDYGTSVYAIDAQTGEEIWASPFSAQWQDYLPPTIYNNKVLINGGTYGGVYAFQAQTGQQIWFHGLSQYDLWTPATFGDVVYTFTGGSNYAQLVAININTGITIWEKTDIPYGWGGYDMNTAPVIDTVNKNVIVTSDDYIHAINFEDQSVSWYKSGSFGITPAIGHENIYIIDNGKLNVYNKSTGNYQWGYQNMNEVNNPPILSNGHVVLCSEQQVKIIDIENHNEVWNFNQGGKAAIGNNHLILSTAVGELYCFESDISIGISEQSIQDEPMIYPNPATNSIFVRLPAQTPEIVNISIYTSMGQFVFERKFSSSEFISNTIKLDVSDYKKGFYIINFETPRNRYNKKIIIE